MVTVSGMAQRLQAPDAALLDLFEQRMRDIWRRDRFVLDDPTGTCRRIRVLLECEGFGSAATLLAKSGAREDWNRVFAEERSQFIADWLLPYLEGQVLDVLGGDFTVLRALVAKGLSATQTVGCERRNAYAVDWSALPFPVRDFDLSLGLPIGFVDTYLICTVLHHEPDLDAFFAILDRGSACRWVVVENCVDDANSEAFHLYVDEFFNKCLNSFDVPCVPQHRTAESWRDLLGAFGRVIHTETRSDVPGMPFPYTLFVIDR
ncbi:MAG TPA: hypothetical protein VFC19_04935 [Candidatus Limnocylindrales bacterium]|nr:hypothetical protein [Candidatus Limnocylindrales bacterium]